MVGLSKQETETFLEEFLGDLRQLVTSLSLDNNRLPRWLKMATVRFGWINESLVAVFDDSTGGDKYYSLGQVGSDTVVIFNTDDFIPMQMMLKAHGRGIVTFVGESQATIFNLQGEYPALFNCGYAGYHTPIILTTIMLQHFPPSNFNPGPVATRFINFALYVHRNDIEPREKFWSRFKESFSDLIVSIHAEKGDYYQNLTAKYNAFAIIKNSSVIVLGKDTDPEVQELVQVRDYLSSKGYDAHLIKDLPEIRVTSNEEKVRSWTGAARFCVMIDRTPSGHISEYLILKQQRSLLAFLRPKGSGSTYMIGDDELVDLNYVKTFLFNRSPLEVLDEVTGWAERMLKNRESAYTNIYPWRKEHTT